METPADVGPWNKVFHPWQGRSGGGYPGSSENTATKMLLTPNDSPRNDRTELCIKPNCSKEKVKMKLFPTDSVLDLNTKNLGNSPSFLTITHTTPSAKWFRSYDISKFDFTAGFCF
jgi:hypothetical protein